MMYDENLIVIILQILHAELLSWPKIVQISLSPHELQTKYPDPRNLAKSWSCTPGPKDELDSTHPILLTGP